MFVDRQLLRTAGSDPQFGPVKDRHNRPRTIPVPQTVAAALSRHQLRYGLGPDGLVFTARNDGKVRHSTFTDAWRRAAEPLGIAGGEGFHQLRHFYASSLIDAGESVKVVQTRLGASSATMTFEVYGQLWPDSWPDTEDRTRVAIDRVLQPGASSVRPATGGDN